MSAPEYTIDRDFGTDSYHVTVKLGNRQIRKTVTAHELMNEPPGYVRSVVNEMIEKLKEEASKPS